jgi:hypothetical protein
MCATWNLTPIIILDLITLIIFCEHWKLRNASFYNFLTYLVTSSFLCPTILGVMFSDISNFCSSLSMRDQFSHQYITQQVTLNSCTEWSKNHATHIKIFIDNCNSVQLDWINKHTVSLWLYKSTRRSRHVVICSRQSVSCLRTVEVQGCLFHKCTDCSLSSTTWHLVLTSLARMRLGIHFPILLCQKNRQYLVWWTVSETQEACRTETVPIDLRC